MEFLATNQRVSILALVLSLLCCNSNSATRTSGESDTETVAQTERFGDGDASDSKYPTPLSGTNLTAKAARIIYNGKDPTKSEMYGVGFELPKVAHSMATGTTAVFAVTCNGVAAKITKPVHFDENKDNPHQILAFLRPAVCKDASIRVNLTVRDRDGKMAELVVPNLSPAAGGNSTSSGPTIQYIFTSLNTYTASIAPTYDLAAFDNECQRLALDPPAGTSSPTRANEFFRTLPGKFKAVLASSTASLETRIKLGSELRMWADYANTSSPDILIASPATTLLSSTVDNILNHRIDHTERGQGNVNSSPEVWTGWPNGTAGSANTNCSDWTNNDVNGNGSATYGNYQSVDQGWIYTYQVRGCGSRAHIYCISGQD